MENERLVTIESSVLHASHLMVPKSFGGAHMSREKDLTDRPVEIGLKCPFCGQTFESKAQLEQHQRNCRERKEQEAR